MKLLWLELKKLYNLLRIAVVWDWKGWDLLSNIFFAAWMESVMMMTLETFSLVQAWLILHLIANCSVSVLVTNAAWCTVLVSGWFAMWMYNIDVTMSFLMLASVIMRAVWCEEEFRRIILSSSWVWILSFSCSFLLTKLKENQSEKLSIIWEPGKNSGLRMGRFHRPCCKSQWGGLWLCSFDSLLENQQCADWDCWTIKVNHPLVLLGCGWWGAWRDKFAIF